MRVDQLVHGKQGEVITIDADAPIVDAVALLATHGIGALVIVNHESKIEGILSERDIVRSLATSGSSTLEQSVKQLMTKNVYTCNRESTIAELMKLVSAKRIRHIPVENNGKLVGIVSIGDIVNARLLELETEREQLEEYISS